MLKKQLFILISILSSVLVSQSKITIQIFNASEMQSVFPYVVTNRIEEFSKYPYLYKGSEQEEYQYLEWFSKTIDGVILIAYDEMQPIALLTGTSLLGYGEHFTQSVPIFQNNQLNPHDYFYISEVIIHESYRGKGLCRKLFNEIESFAKRQGYKFTCFVCEEHEQHNLKPTTYKKLAPVWKMLGYQKSAISITFEWLTIQVGKNPALQNHTLDYWIKKIDIEVSYEENNIQ